MSLGRAIGRKERHRRDKLGLVQGTRMYVPASPVTLIISSLFHVAHRLKPEGKHKHCPPPERNQRGLTWMG